MSIPTLKVLRKQTFDWLADSGQLSVPVDVVDNLLNHAYEELLTLVRASHQVWCLAPTVLSLTTTAGTREYVLSTHPTADPELDLVHKVVDCVRRDGAGSIPVDLHPMLDRDTGTPVPWPQLRARGPYGGYVFRGDDGLWRFGLMEQNPPAAATYEFHWLRKFIALAREDSQPMQIPDVLHKLIAINAAVMIKSGIQQRDPTGLQSIASRFEAQAREELASLYGAGKAVNF